MGEHRLGHRVAHLGVELAGHVGEPGVGLLEGALDRGLVESEQRREGGGLAGRVGDEPRVHHHGLGRQRHGEHVTVAVDDRAAHREQRRLHEALVDAAGHVALRLHELQSHEEADQQQAGQADHGHHGGEAPAGVGGRGGRGGGPP